MRTDLKFNFEKKRFMIFKFWWIVYFFIFAFQVTRLILLHVLNFYIKFSWQVVSTLQVFDWFAMMFLYFTMFFFFLCPPMVNFVWFGIFFIGGRIFLHPSASAVNPSSSLLINRTFCMIKHMLTSEKPYVFKLRLDFN